MILTISVKIGSTSCRSGNSVNANLLYRHSHKRILSHIYKNTHCSTVRTKSEANEISLVSGWVNNGALSQRGDPTAPSCVACRHLNRNRKSLGPGVEMMTNAMLPKSKIDQNTLGINKNDLRGAWVAQ